MKLAVGKLYPISGKLNTNIQPLTQFNRSFMYEAACTTTVYFPPV